MSFNTFKYRALISLAIALPSYLILSMIQGFNIFDANFYALYEYCGAVFLTMLALFELHNFKSIALEKNFPWDKKQGVRIGLEVLFTIIVTPVVVSLAYKLFYNLVWDMDIYFPSLVFYNSLAFFISLFFLAYVNAGYILSNWKSAVYKANALEKENMRAQLKALQNQLSPHFLFNNFNILNALIEEDVREAKVYLNKLSEVFRYILQNKHSEVVKLEDELTFINNYAFLIGTRFKNKFDLKIDIPKSAYSKKIPPVSLQVLLENALQHNEVSAKHPLVVKICVKGDKLTIDNVVKKKKGQVKSTKTGLSNIVSRYEFLTDEKVEIHNGQERFKIILPLLN